MVTESLFPDANELSFLGIVISIGVYGYILLMAADFIGDGADELLEALPNYGTIIGALLVPVLGAIPDGMMILLSGMGNGTKAEIQRELNVGVGTLAGSTIMLLTLPFAVAIFVNRRPIGCKGQAEDIEESGQDGNEFTEEAKLSYPNFISKTAADRPLYHTKENDQTFAIGSTVGESLPMSAKIMMGSTITYLVVQVPAFFASQTFVQKASLLSFVVSLALLFIYCIYSATKSDDQHRQDYVRLKREMKQNKLLEDERWHANT
eukprot:210252-Amorphochlora_amoeboformis.AAC.2